MASGKRAREIFEAAQVTPPTPADLEDGFVSWVDKNVPRPGLVEASMWIGGLPDAKRRKIVDCSSREEFLERVTEPSNPTSSTVMPPPRTAEVLEAAADAFLSYPFDNADILDDLWRKLGDDYMKWTSGETKFLAPYFAMVQSSGWGKSRLVSELHRKGLYVVYVSCMHPNSSRFPIRTPILADMICNVHSTLESMAAFLIGSMRVLKTGQAQAGPEEWIKMQTDPKLGFPLSDKIAKEAEQAKVDIAAAIRDDKVDKAVADALKAAVKELAGVAGFFGHQLDRGLKVLFCFDEATPLVEATPRGLAVNCFTLLRRALGSIKTGVWSVVLGTNPRLLAPGGGAPPRRQHPSDKASNLGYDLFKPFWQTGVGVAPEQQQQEAVEVQQQEEEASVEVQQQQEASVEVQQQEEEASVEVQQQQEEEALVEVLQQQEEEALVEVQQAFRIGRPLWRALLDRKKYNPGELLGLAKQKLNVTSKYADLSDEMVVGVLGCTIGLDVAAWSEVAIQSMTYHMMTVAWISEDTRLVYVANAAEPVLAAAGATYLMDEDFQFHALARLSRMCKEGTVMPGPREEIVSRFLLLLAILLCHRDKESTLFVGRVTIREFLTKLLGGVPPKLNESIDLDGSELQLNSLSPTHREVSNELLEECFQLRRGLTCRPGQEVVDCVLRSSNGDIGFQAMRWERDNKSKMKMAVGRLERGLTGRRKKTSELDPKQVEKLGQIQIDAPKRAAANVEAGTGTGVKFMLGLVFQLGSQEERTWVEGPEHKTIVVHGFSQKLYPFLSPRVVEVLQDILKLRTSSYIHKMTEREQAVARRMHIQV